MPLTLGELVDKIRALEEAEEDVREAERSLSFGGNESIMAGKKRALDTCERHAAYLRDQPVIDEEL